jgi:mono/diheme cytochrome c family protein
MIFDEACAPCHVRGSRRDDPGASGPEPDLADKAYGRLTPAQLAARFDGGHGSDLGSVFGPEDIRAILSYLPDLSYPSDAPGSAVSGRKIYRRYCSSCHGLKGDGNGPAVALLNTVPSAFTRDTLVGARDFAALARVIREGPGHPHVSSMPAWGLFFDQRMLDDVAAYLPTFQAGGSGATRSPPPSSGSPPA